MLRDILLGRVPPSLFINPVYVIMAFVTVLILFFIIRFNQQIMTGPYIVAYEKIMNIFDAVGLAAFTVTGIDTAAIMAGQTPYILKKHVYACASLAGAIFYVYLSGALGSNAAMVTGALLVIAIRLLATKYCWDLPKATADEPK